MQSEATHGMVYVMVVAYIWFVILLVVWLLLLLNKL